jgi:hypothetical protein
MENSKTLKDHIINALIHFFYNFFVNFIFLTPFKLWVKATERLSYQRDEGGLEISKITGMWPFLSFLKRFILDFLIDGFIFITYFISPLIFLYSLSQGEGMGSFAILIGGYYLPLLLSLYRDFIQLCILPFKKFLSWASKPAQYMDLEIKNK